MEIEKIETNLKRNLFLYSSHVKFFFNDKNIENNIIRINPDFTFQEILGFRRSSYRKFLLYFKYNRKRFSQSNFRRIFL